MATPFEVSDSIVKRWLANWTGTTKTFLEGEKSRPVRGQPYASLIVRHLPGEQASQGAEGNRKFLRIGQVDIEIAVPDSSGTKVGNGLAHDARAVFEATSFDGMRFFSADVVELGPEGEWLMFLATCPFDYHETK